MPNCSANAWRAGIDVNSNDHVGTGESCALNHVQPDTAQAKHRHVITRLHLCGIDDRTDTGGYAATDVTNLVKWRIFADFRDCDLGHYRKV